jgi:hypothetical protein
MERRFGYDFSRVRVHSDSIAQRSAREVNANAYTVGDNIVIGAGNYSLRSREGLQLIAHELAHVVQQSRADRSQVASSNTRTNIFPHSTLYRAALGESGSIMPKLSFCQYGSGFCGMAAQQAKRLKAPGEDVLTCKRPPDIGVISYNTGADIIGAIGAPNRCYGWKLNELHFFGHSGNYGVFDSSNSGEIHRGLYVDWYYDHNVSDSDKQNGARKASQIPVSALSDQVVFVFHSCNTALKHSNVPPVAEGVYSRLSGTLREPKVYGHYYQVATGQLDDWIAYSRQFSSGRYQKRIIYHRQPFSR